MPGRWGTIPCLVMLACLGTGIAASTHPIPCIFPLLAAGSAALVLAGVIGLERTGIPCLLPVSLASMLLAGICLGIAGREGVPGDDLRSLFDSYRIPLDRPILLEGCVAEEPETRGAELLVTIEVHACESGEGWLRCRGKILLRVPRELTPGQPAWAAEISYGDRIRVWSTCARPRNFRNPGYVDRVANLSRKGIHFVGRVKSPRLVEVLPGNCGMLWKRSAVEARRRVRSLIRGPSELTAASEVLISLIIGDHAGLPAGTREVFQSAGTYHVLVVSGLHVGWIAWLLSLALKRLRLPEAAGRIVVMVAILCYSAIVGFQASVSRCLWLYALYFGAQSLFRAANAVNMALAAAFFLLVVNPDWLFDIGFQLSFCSVLSILWLGTHFVESGLRPLLDPVLDAGGRERLHCGRGTLHETGRRWRVTLELMAESWADRRHDRLERVALMAIRGAARLALLVAGTVLITLSVQVALGPLLAYHFNRLSWIAPLANLFSVPLAALALAAGAAGVCLGAAGLPASAIMDLALGCSDLLVTATYRVASWTGSWQRCPTPPLHAVLLLPLIPAVWRLLQWRRIWWPCALCLIYQVWLSAGPEAVARVLPRISPPRAEPLEITVLDVGQGDSIVLRFPDRSLWVLDAGGMRDPGDGAPGPAAFDPGETVVSRFLWSRGIRRIDRLLLSHAHLDHAGGMEALMRNFRTGSFHYGEWKPDGLRERLLALARGAGIISGRLSAGGPIHVGGVLVEVLNPPADGRYRSVNDGSLVLQLRYGRFSALLAGDLEEAGETHLVSRRSDLGGLLLKVAHHGSRFATLDPFLDRSRPRWAILSVGRNNPFGHPAGEVLHRLHRHGARPLHTFDQGALTLSTDGKVYTLSSFAGGILDSGTLPGHER